MVSAFSASDDNCLAYLLSRCRLTLSNNHNTQYRQLSLNSCADEMGLGKTLQMLSLIASSLAELKRNAIEGEEYHTHCTLIIVPPALVSQWMNEVKKSTGDTLKVVSVTYFMLRFRISLLDDYLPFAHSTLIIVPPALVNVGCKQQAHS